jgi:hypothetical protein
VTRAWLPAIACAAILVALAGARPQPTPGPFLRDFEAYWSAGSTSNAGADPYGRAIWNAERRIAGVDARRDETLPFVNPPATLLAWTLFARLPYALAASCWVALLVSGVIALAATVLYAARTIGPTDLIAALALAVGFGPITSDLALGQVALPAFLGAALVARARSLPVATLWGCVAFAQPNLALGLVSSLARRGVTVALALAATIVYGVGAAYGGPAWPVWYAQVISAHAAAERFSAIQVTVASIGYGFGASAFAAQIAAVAAAGLAVAAAVLLARKLDDSFERFAAFSALVPFVAGFLHEHDLVVAYPAAAWCALRTRGAARAVALTGTLLVAVDWLGLAQRPTGIAQSALLAIAALTAFLALGEAGTAESALLVVVPAFAALFAAAAWLAVHNAVPIWPDALGAFHAPSGATIAALWAAQQRASGLLAAQPVWAGLRSLSLLGCALLAYAICQHSSYCRTASMRWDESP